MLFTHVGQMNSSVEDLLRLPIKSKINQKYVYPIQIDMQITCPPQSDLALIKKANDFTNSIPYEIEQDIKNNHCKLLLDYTSESYDITSVSYTNLKLQTTTYV